jgi:hypothetical protein
VEITADIPSLKYMQSDRQMRFEMVHEKERQLSKVLEGRNSEWTFTISAPSSMTVKNEDPNHSPEFLTPTL